MSSCHNGLEFSNIYDKNINETDDLHVSQDGKLMQLEGKDSFREILRPKRNIQLNVTEYG